MSLLGVARTTLTNGHGATEADFVDQGLTKFGSIGLTSSLTSLLPIGTIVILRYCDTANMQVNSYKAVT